MKFPGFVGGTGRAQSPIAGIERTLNWYPEAVGGSAPKTDYVLYPTPGVATFATAAETPGRGMVTVNGRGFVVIGFKFYETIGNGTLVDRGSVVYDTTPVSFAHNGDAGDQIFLGSAGYGYCFNLITNVLTLVLDPASGDYRADQVAYLSGRFLALDAQASILSISNQFDGLTWDPGLVSQRSLGGDPWVALLVAGLEIVLMGTLTTEVWYDAGASPFPFQPIQGALINHGTPCASSLAKIGSVPFWVGQNEDGSGMVMTMGDGFTARRISTHPVDVALQGSTVTDAVGWTYQALGHSFYVLSLPTARQTHVYDAATGIWHERGYFDNVHAREEAWRPCFHMFLFGKHLTLDRDGGRVLWLDAAHGSDVGGVEIHRIRRAPHINVERRRVTFHEFELELETGLGLSTGQGSDPTVMLRISKDGGKTWGNGRTASAGRMGEYLTRVCWQRLGDGRDVVFEVSVSDPVPWKLINAFLQLAVGTN